MAEAPNAILLDSGSICGEEAQMPMAFQALKSMRYTAVGVGSFDMRSFAAYVKNAKEAGIPVVNVGNGEAADTVPYVIKDVGGKRVGIVCFGYVEKKDDTFDLKKRRYAAFQEARSKSDILVLMDKAGVATEDWLQRNEKRLGSPDLIVGAESMNHFAEMKTVGRTRILPTGLEGKYVGLLKIEVQPDKQLKVDYSRKYLGPDVPEDPDIRKLVDDYNKAQQEKVQKQSEELMAKLKAQQASLGGSKTSHTIGSGPYYDSKSCAQCHKTQYESWLTTKHAKAVTTLEVNNALKPECLICHSERYKSIVTDISRDTSYKQGVECASCHVKALPHGPAGPPKQTNVKLIDLDNCRVCHTKERSAEFDDHSDEYWNKAKHTPAAKT